MFVNISSINDRLLKDCAEYIKNSDGVYEQSIQRVADCIIDEKAARPVILISGPSGSGKTTSAHKLEAILDNAGFPSMTLSIDNFFFPMTEEDKKLHAEHKLDLESPARVDAELLSRTLNDITEYKPVYLPQFDFTTNTRSYSKKPLIRQKNELVVLEGTHALNPDVVTVDPSKTLPVYVSVRTRVQTDGGEMIHPEYIRLMRRMIRDSLYRGRTFTKNAQMYKSVQEGENKYIMPYKHRSVFDIDTFIAYEINVYRDLILEGLRKEGLDKKIPQLEKMLSHALPLDKSAVPTNSLLREFLGK